MVIVVHPKNKSATQGTRKKCGILITKALFDNFDYLALARFASSRINRLSYLSVFLIFTSTGFCELVGIFTVTHICSGSICFFSQTTHGKVAGPLQFVI